MDLCDQTAILLHTMVPYDRKSLLPVD